MAVVEMTDEEKALLDLAYTDGGRILEGKLFDYQEKALTELRTCREVLQKRYPQEEFKIISFQPSSKKGCVEMEFVQPGKVTTEYLLKYENGEYSDNFYDVPYEREYDGIVEGILEEAGIRVRVFTTFPFLISDEIKSGRELMDRRPHLGRHTAIFVPTEKLPSQEEKQELAAKVQTVFKENGIYSSCIIFYVLGMERLGLESVLDLNAYCRNRENLGNVSSLTFRCFQVDK